MTFRGCFAATVVLAGVHACSGAAEPDTCSSSTCAEAVAHGILVPPRRQEAAELRRLGELTTMPSVGRILDEMAVEPPSSKEVEIADVAAVVAAATLPPTEDRAGRTCCMSLEDSKTTSLGKRQWSTFEPQILAVEHNLRYCAKAACTCADNTPYTELTFNGDSETQRRRSVTPYVVYEMELLENQYTWGNGKESAILSTAKEVWSFSVEHCERLRQEHDLPCFFVPLYLATIPSETVAPATILARAAQATIGAMMIATYNSDRYALCNDLVAMSKGIDSGLDGPLKTSCGRNIQDPEKTQAMQQSKLLVNIPYYDKAPLPTHRIDHSLLRGLPVSGRERGKTKGGAGGHRGTLERQSIVLGIGVRTTVACVL